MHPSASPAAASDPTAQPLIADLAVVAAHLRTAIAAGDADALWFLADEIDRHALWGERDPLTGAWGRKAVNALTPHRSAQQAPDQTGSTDGPQAVVVISLDDLYRIGTTPRDLKERDERLCLCVDTLQTFCDPCGAQLLQAQEDVLVVLDNTRRTMSEALALADALRGALTAVEVRTTFGVALQTPGQPLFDTLRAADHARPHPVGIWDGPASVR